MNDFADVINSLNLDDPRSNISAIKGAVKERLEASDENVTVALTDHFNHSYVPDLVLSWPGEKDSREVFLRTSFRQDGIARDIATLGSQKPIFMSLAPVQLSSAELVQPAARQTNSLVFDPYSLQAMGDLASEKPVVSMLSHAVLQGGRGVIDTETATSSGDSVNAGFDGARNGDAVATTTAVDAVEGLLDPARASQINRLLYAAWIGSGQAASAFPGAAGITGTLDPLALRFILRLPEIEDDDFWRRIGRELTTERLCELRDFANSANLERLVRGAAYRLTAKGCRLRRSSSSSTDPQWSVRDGLLTLSVSGEDVSFAPRTLDQLPPPEPSFRTQDVATIQERAAESEVRLGEVRLSDGAHAVMYAAEAVDGDISRAAALSALQTMMPGAALISAVAHVANKELRCNFDSRTVRGNGPARFALGDLVTVALPLLTSIRRIEMNPAVAQFESPAKSAAASADDS